MRQECDRVVLPVEILAANGKQGFNCLSHPPLLPRNQGCTFTLSLVQTATRRRLLKNESIPDDKGSSRRTGSPASIGGSRARPPNGHRLNSP